jgi:hypothetical protein
MGANGLDESVTSIFRVKKAFTLKMDAAGSFEILVAICPATLRHISEHRNFNWMTFIQPLFPFFLFSFFTVL